MNDQQENRLSAGITLNTFLHQTASVAKCAPILTLVAKVSELDHKISEIQGVALVQSKDTTGIAQDKEAAKDETAKETVRILVSPMLARALDTNNNTLKTLVDYSFSDLFATRDTQFPTRIQGLIDEATLHTPDYLPYGMVAGDITIITGLLAGYVTLEQAPRLGITVKESATKQLKEKFSELSQIEANLDVFMDRFNNTTDIDFFNQYHAARKLVNNIGGGTSTPSA